MKAPTVSVILPMYNSSMHIGPAIESVLSQTFRDFEVVVVDDGSTDNSAALAEALGVRVLRQANSGPAGARNAGIRASSQDTPYIAFQDADEVWNPEKLARQIEAMEREPDAVLSHTNGVVVFADSSRGPVPKDHVPEPGGPAISHILPSNSIFTSTVVLRRGVLEKSGLFHDPLRAAEDWDLWFRLVPHGAFLFDFQPLVERLVHDNGTSRDATAMWRGRVNVLEQRVPLVLDDILRVTPTDRHRDVRRSLRRQLALSYSSLAKHCGMEGRMAEARQMHRKALALAPEIARIHLRFLRAYLPSGIQTRVARRGA